MKENCPGIPEKRENLQKEAQMGKEKLNRRMLALPFAGLSPGADPDYCIFPLHPAAPYKNAA